MKLTCVECGNYAHFICDVEMIQGVEPTSGGLQVKDRDREGTFDSGSWVRMGIEELIDYCCREDLGALVKDPETGHLTNPRITCARCGSNRVCVPFRTWSPPRSDLSLDQEITRNRKELLWLRKERERYGYQLPLWQS